ncbi:leucine-rich repeat, immunoglobulin-like domain and transmembrane domain-containing protein 1b [Nothobranchius furzeri]|uniref:Leucine-rich repeat, immunoglobulin-like domain and transmembrane domain-containing protein 1 n=1 Tax=Nothobranchius furzeri TaxID=105023 RepID=A0A8C6LA59_NOTFU|nr:leucine-rich repeat, immunoglobulin-like domain and transmembrane domain-containing protein 1b [Nothobranchius furzeri]KAF7204223.1 Ig-like and transmembrane domains 1 [Nothobranchius furzeri]
MIQHFSAAFCLALVFLPLLSSSCPSQCSCFYHKLSDGSKARSVLCNDPEITVIPSNFPSDTSKLRIEKTAITRIASSNFHYLNNLEFLWMSFNSLNSLKADSFRGLYTLNELRLDGNSLTSFPWEALIDMPILRLLDLHNNKISTIPVSATMFIKNITYLDLSSNSLTTIPAEVLTMWLSVKPSQDMDSSKLILGLHDNPWLCDCRLYDLVQFQKSPSSSVALIDTRLRCADPESLSGVFFTEAELQKCQVPRVHTAVARVQSSLGNNVLLRCGTVGVPIPDLSWSRADGKKMNGTIQDEISKEGIIWSILSVPAVSYKDSGKYVCKATNFVGTADAIISLVIADSIRSEEAVGGVSKRGRGKKTGGTGRAAYQEKLIARYVPPSTSTAAQPVIEPLNGKTVTGKYEVESYSVSDGAYKGEGKASNLQKPVEVGQSAMGNLAANTSSLQQVPEKRVVRSVKVIGDTDHTVSLNWRAPTATNTTEFSVLYAVFGERDMRRINVGAGKNRITIEGLVPKTKYIACICVKGLIPKKEQCVIFSTDEAASASGTQKLINVVVITVACVIAVPLTLIVCCGALKKRCQKMLGRQSKDLQDSYVTFETLGPGGKPKVMEGEYLTRLNPDESNRLLSARSSVDSEAIARTEGPPNEYFC